MRFSFKWLKAYVDIDKDPSEIAESLTMAGLEVEGVEDKYPHLRRVTAVRITDIKDHPKAERLKICKVSDGTKVYSVVCGAPNVTTNKVVPLALPGAELPSGLTIEETVIRGEKSEGMLCSIKELALGEDGSGLWTLPDDTPLGIPLDKALGIDDVILDISITPNRGDCLSIIGLAREIAAIYEKPLKYPEILLKEEGPPIETVARVDIEDMEKCPRYAARVVFDVAIQESPEWLKRRLESAGIRAINNIVDVTNYVMLELGQPLHAFDYERLAEHRIVVRCANEGDRFITLDGQERTLFNDSLLICDGEKPVAIAGIMGGEFSGIYEDTKHVLIESAFFDPSSIRRTSKKIRLGTESSYRFERSVDPEGVIRALDRAAQLMVELGGGRLAKGRIDVYPRPFSQQKIVLRVDRTNRYLGTQLTRSEVTHILRRLFMEVNPSGKEDLEVVPPSFRQDITREVDITEEIARIYGYGNIPTRPPQIQMAAVERNDHLSMRSELRDFMKSLGFREVITYSFVSRKALDKLRLSEEDPRKNPLRVLNPLSEDQAVMRTSLVPSMLQIVLNNLDHQNGNLRLFELSKVFIQNQGQSLPDETFRLVAVMVGNRGLRLLYRDDEIDYSDIKGIADGVMDFFKMGRLSYKPLDSTKFPYMNPALSAQVFSREEELGVVGRIHPFVAEDFGIEAPVWILELDYEKLFSLRTSTILYKPLPRYPSVARDIALVVSRNFPVQEGLDFIRNLKEPLIEKVEVFDIFESPQLGEGKKSVAYRLIYRSQEKSLTDEEVNVIHEGIAKLITEHFKITLR